ncbi:hypothetical protein CISIN_1g034846mg [Citrus sinensis]|uniref:Uncharacterized protein n=1 Tax=Citrus sinensis TaxID=2711 RepID=A0A067FVU9_CITSI|nr:hypothetical protein CISIN_1g034846mg [Citrus sinensis]
MGSMGEATNGCIITLINTLPNPSYLFRLFKIYFGGSKSIHYSLLSDWELLISSSIFIWDRPTRCVSFSFSFFFLLFLGLIF